MTNIGRATPRSLASTDAPRPGRVAGAQRLRGRPSQLTGPETLGVLGLAGLVLLSLLPLLVQLLGYITSGQMVVDGRLLLLLLLTLVPIATLAAAPWFPRAAATTSAAGHVALFVLGNNSGDRSVLVLACVLYCLARVHPALGAVFMVVIVGVGVGWTDREVGVGPPEPLSVVLLEATLIPVAVFAAALFVRSWLSVGEQRRQLAVRETVVDEQAAATAERASVTAERARIARELHDVVAHHVSLVAVRAETAPYTEPDLSPSARGVLAEIAASARLALDELRTVLGVLRRADTDELELAPQPGINDVTTLVEQARSSGTPVDYTALPPDQQVPDAAGLAAYRIVQEALTNARRHAPGAAVTVRVSVEQGRLLVSVRNAAAAAAPAGSALRGYGHAGMHERVAALGGSLWVGPLPDGGYAVEATIPLGLTP